MLPSTCSREALLARPPFPSWNLPLFTMESTFSSVCLCSDPPLSRQGAALTHLDSLFMIWYSGQTALFLFHLARAALVFLPTALSVALRSLFPFQQAQYAQVFSAEACAILHAFCWCQRHQQVCHFSSTI